MRRIQTKLCSIRLQSSIGSLTPASAKSISFSAKACCTSASFSQSRLGSRALRTWQTSLSACSSATGSPHRDASAELEKPSAPSLRCRREREQLSVSGARCDA